MIQIARELIESPNAVRGPIECILSIGCKSSVIDSAVFAIVAASKRPVANGPKSA